MHIAPVAARREGGSGEEAHPPQSSLPRTWIVVLSVLIVTAAHVLTPASHYVLHNLYQRLYYLPILLACGWFGRTGGMITAAACAGAYVPHIFMQWEDHPPYQVSQVAELAMFLVIAALAGTLLDREKAQRSAAEAVARERDQALHDLEETVETLRRADRLATLGTMAAGMAHEIRNPLGALLGAAEILGRDFPPDHPRREFYDILERELGRLNAIATKYVDFARPQPPELRPINPNEAMEAAVDLVRKSAGRASVRIAESLTGDPPAVLADPVHLHQALVNLLLNGVQAMPEGGVLEVATKHAGNAVELVVRDHGVGLPDGPVTRIFEPFFTTRSGGTGLGLAIAKHIAEAHGGSLTAEAAEGGGACFRLRLRVAEGPGG